MLETLRDIEKQIEELHRNANNMGTDVYRIVDQNGAPLFSPLIVAKAQCLHSLALLQSERIK